MKDTFTPLNDVHQNQHIRESQGRRIALYPGAFRPPHAAHYAAVHHLLTLPHIDEVVVIISNRARPIPGTTLALDATTAQHIWSIYLQGIKKVRVEVAAHTAVSHAFDYFNRADAGDTLLFCLGEADISQGDDRFRNLISLSTQSGIQASLIQSPTGSLPIRSTSLRTALIQGDTGRDEFFAALPTHLIPKQRDEVWNVCQEGIREMSDVVKEKIHDFIIRISLGKIEELSSTEQGKLDRVWRVRFKEGHSLFVKYAGDALGTEELGQGQMLKPRDRLSVERKALKWVRDHIHSPVAIPKIVYFEKKTWTLVLSEVCPNGHSLQDDLQNGVFNPNIAAKAAQFLSECQTKPNPVPPLRDSEETDRQHWKTMLGIRTLPLKSKEFLGDVQKDLAALQHISEKAEENGFLHLDFQPKNILVSKETIGVIDFELSSGVGDPAYDFGFFCGHYIYWGLRHSSIPSSQNALPVMIKTYQEGIGDIWYKQQDRIVGFTGATLLSIFLERDRPDQEPFRNLLLCTAKALLSWKHPPKADATHMLLKANTKYFS